MVKMGYLISKTNTERIIEEYNINVDSTEPIECKNLSSSTRVFKIRKSNLTENLYIIETVSGRRIACHPHIVGTCLKSLALEAALDAAKAINELTGLHKTNPESVIFEHVLRAAPGYELHTAFKQLNRGKPYREVWIRPLHERPSYRDHDHEEASPLKIVYEDFRTLPRDKEIIVLKPDTEATGRTGQLSVERLIERSDEVGSTIRRLILYGFISAPALKIIGETTQKHGIELFAFSIGNITDLAYNGYDMTLYGVDESYWKATGKIKKLGSIVDFETLTRYTPEFIPGLDQPGDWSNRQALVNATEKKTEPGLIREHLTNSIKILESLMAISDFKDWQTKIARKELRLLHASLEKQD
jgi:hypothetical protein